MCLFNFYSFDLNKTIQNILDSFVSLKEILVFPIILHILFKFILRHALDAVQFLGTGVE